MEENVLVDSSYFISHLRRRQDPFLALAGADDKYEFYSCGVLAEVCCGMIQPQAYDLTRRQFDVMSWVPTTSRIWERITQVSWELARKGIVVKLPDLIIAVSAMEADAAVLTLDSGFSFVPRIASARGAGVASSTSLYQRIHPASGCGWGDGVSATPWLRSGGYAHG